MVTLLPVLCLVNDETDHDSPRLPSAGEQYYCNFGVNPDYVSFLTQGLLRISGADAEGEVRVDEHSGHSLFIGTPFVPQQRQRDKERILCDTFYEGVLENTSASSRN